MSESFFRFLIVGTIGFIVNFFCLFIFFDLLKLSIVVAQIISVETALVATFIGNNFWAFKGHLHHKLPKKFAKYQITALMGVGINSATVIILVSFFDVFYGLALAFGSVAGLSWNYTANRHVVFSKSKKGFRERLKIKIRKILNNPKTN